MKYQFIDWDIKSIFEQQDGTYTMQGYYRLPNLLISGKIYSHLADIEEQAQDLFSRLVKEHAEKEGVTEYLKAIDQMK